MRLVLILISSLLITSCVNYRGISAGEIGCQPQDITIHDAKMRATNHTWVAECKSKRFVCSSYASGKGGVAATCNPELTD